jgi:LysM repeat protein
MAITVQKGDTLSAIAQANNTTVGDLARINNIADVNKINVGQSLNLKGSGFIEPQRPIAADSFSRPVQDTSKVQGAIAEASLVQPQAGINASNRISNAPDVIPPEPAVAETLTMRERVEQGMLDQLGRDTVGEKAQLREDANIKEKADESNRLRNQIRTERLDFEDQRQELKKNTEGRSTGAVNNDINKLTENFNRNSVRSAIKFDIANGDFLAAQQTVNDAIADLNAESTRKTALFGTLMSFMNNDMTESEKLQAQQSFSEKQANEDFARQKELIDYKASISGGGAPDVQQINGVDSIWNPVTGTFQPISLEAGGDAVAKAENQLKFLDKTAADLSTLAKDTSGFKTPVGPSGITRFVGDLFVGNTAFRQAENLAQSLKTNVLTLQTDPAIKKFFGPQMSEADVQMMSAGGTTLDPQAQSPTQFTEEVERVQDMVNRALTAVARGSQQVSQGGNFVTAPDGTVVEIIN